MYKKTTGEMIDMRAMIDRAIDRDKLNNLRERFLKVCVEYCDKCDELFGIYEG